MKITLLFLLSLSCLVTATQIKNVAVVETEVDESSGASSGLTSAEVRLITTELRREAVKNLPRGTYNVMTTETVYAQGSAVLEECADENCVISLGSRIGADYIVRGIISKFQTRFTLSVEIYDTEDGNLVASSDPVRSENINELLEKSAPVCADMYKTFATAQTAQSVSVPKPPRKLTGKPTFWIGAGFDVLGAGLLACGLYENNNVAKIKKNGYYKSKGDYKTADSAAKNRNAAYIAGSAFLLSGITVHIFF
jgi:TolB-like protein